MIEHYCDKTSCPVYSWTVRTSYSSVIEDCTAEVISKLKEAIRQLNLLIDSYNSHSHNEIDGLKKTPDILTQNSQLEYYGYKTDQYQILQGYSKSNFGWKTDGNEIKICMVLPLEDNNKIIPLECLACSNFKKIDMESLLLVGDAVHVLSK